MYKTSYFTEDNRQAVLDFMHAHPFVTLIAYDGRKNVATQIPVLLYEKGAELLLRAHIMRNTDHCKAILQNPDVLILFAGPHCYVSSSWYSEKMGATWNYQTVHVNGSCTILNDEETFSILKELTERFEQPQERPLYIDALPDNYVSSHIKAITGLEIKVNDIYPIFKLSQNRDNESYRNIVQHLEKSEDTDARKIAAEMRLRRRDLF
jgi:transcriptional regulator